MYVSLQLIVALLLLRHLQVEFLMDLTLFGIVSQHTESIGSSDFDGVRQQVYESVELKLSKTHILELAMIGIHFSTYKVFKCALLPCSLHNLIV